MKTYAMDDFDVIRARRAEIARLEIPRCPQNSDRTLHDCLRLTSSMCGESCPFKNDWIGPNA